MKEIIKKNAWFTAITMLCLVAVTLFAVSGCNKSGIPEKEDLKKEKPEIPNEEEPEKKEPEEEGLYIFAKVENASEYSNVVEVKLVIDAGNDTIELARGDWKDGGFSIILPKTVAPNYLYALIDNYGLPTTQIIASVTASIINPNAKIQDAFFWGIDKDDKVVCIFEIFEIDEDGNPIITYNHNIRYRYVDSDVTVSGYTEHTNSVFNHTNIFSIEWKKGWNVLWILESAVERKSEYKWLTIHQQSEMVWYGFAGTNYHLLK